MIEPKLKPSFVRAVQCAVFAGDGDKWRFYVDPWTARRYKTFSENEKRDAAVMADANPCPVCGGELEHRRHRFSSDRGPNLPDCDWLACSECDFQTEPE